MHKNCFLHCYPNLGSRKRLAGSFRASTSFANACLRRRAAVRVCEKFRLGLQPKFRVPSNRLACRFPKLAGSSGDFAVAEFDLVLAKIFLVRCYVPVHKFVVSIIPVDCLFCVVAANRWCIHQGKCNQDRRAGAIRCSPLLEDKTRSFVRDATLNDG